MLELIIAAKILAAVGLGIVAAFVLFVAILSMPRF